MKCFVAVLVLAIVAVALADSKPVEAESIEPVKSEVAPAEAARDKRGVLVGAYTAPVAYSAYTAPIAYSAYSYPYAYSAYSAYPYYAAGYSSAYYLA